MIEWQAPAGIGWLEPDRDTIPMVVGRQAERFGDKVCMHLGDTAITYAEMETESNRAANGLEALGVRRGDCVPLLMENRPEALHTWFGANKLGAIQVPLNTALRGEFLRHQLATCEAATIVVEHDLIERVLHVADQCPALKTVVVVGRASEPDRPVEDPGPRHVRLVAWDEFLGDDSSPEARSSLRYDDPAAIVFTGGTTGPSKGPIVSHHYMLNMANVIYRLRGTTPDDLTYSPLPLYHLNAPTVTVLGSLMNGATGALDRRFSVSRFWQRVHDLKATHAVVLGSMITMLFNRPPTDADRQNPLKVLYGGPVPADLHERIAKRWQVEIRTGYGLSEAGLVTYFPVGEQVQPGACGRPSPQHDVMLVDDDGRPVRPGEVGEFLVRPREPSVMFDGYFNMASATLEQMKNLWFHTGDLGRRDDDGIFYFVDRKKDAMRRRGENVSSFEVERAVLLHPAVEDVAAHAVPSEFTEDDIKICVVVKHGAALDHEQLLHHCAEHMPYFAVPRYIEFLDALPKSPVGRVLKFELRKQGITPGTWDRETAGAVVQR